MLILLCEQHSEVLVITYLHELLDSFAPNDPMYSANYTGWDGMSTADLQSIYKYGIVRGMPLYSSELKNNSRYVTLQGASITITWLGDELYIDLSRVVVKDYLTANGVLQVLDR